MVVFNNRRSANLVMVLFHSRIAELMHTPVEAMVDTKNYILVCSLGILFIVGYNVVCGILRGLGEFLKHHFILLGWHV